jgi:hypothetical protein
MRTLPTDAINLAHALHEVQVILARKTSDKIKLRDLTLLMIDQDMNKRLDRILPELRK